MIGSVSCSCEYQILNDASQPLYGTVVPIPTPSHFTYETGIFYPANLSEKDIVPILAEEAS